MPADAARLATMKANGIVSIAINDGDFLRVLALEATNCELMIIVNGPYVFSCPGVDR